MTLSVTNLAFLQHTKMANYRNRPKQSAVFDTKARLNLAVVHIGAPCCGMNAAVRSFVRNCIITGEMAQQFTL